MTQTGRIENEPHDIYHGQHDKPAFGSSAIKLWITDREQFYRTYVTGEIQRPMLGRAGVIGNAVEEPLLEGTNRNMVSSTKTATAQKFKAEQEENPDKLLLTPSESDMVDAVIQAGLDDELLTSVTDAGTPQVTYRIDVGPFYVQCRVDVEAQVNQLVSKTIDDLNLSGTTKLLVDLKTTATLYGSKGFQRAAVKVPLLYPISKGFQRAAVKVPLLYPIQEALYTEIVRTVDKVDQTQIPFWFCAIAKDEPAVQWVQFQDLHNKARKRVMGAIGELKVNYESGCWDEFKGKTRTVFLPETYLDWAGE
jgi:hypothetical protein